MSATEHMGWPLADPNSPSDIRSYLQTADAADATIGPLIRAADAVFATQIAAGSGPATTPVPALTMTAVTNFISVNTNAASDFVEFPRTFWRLGGQASFNAVATTGTLRKMLLQWTTYSDPSDSAQIVTTDYWCNARESNTGREDLWIEEVVEMVRAATYRFSLYQASAGAINQLGACVHWCAPLIGLET